MTIIQYTCPVIGLCAYSGSGKTTLLEKIIPILNEKNIRIAVIKHAHHSFDIDHPNKDSYKIRKAGAQQMLISSSNRWALMHENETSSELTLEHALSKLDADLIDLVIVEGFKSAAIPKIEIHRPRLERPLISDSDSNVIAIATDDPKDIKSNLPKLDLNSAEQIANFIIQFIG